jgi:translation initiation factor IF-3
MPDWASVSVYTAANAGHPHHEARLSAPCPPHRSNLSYLLLEDLPHAQLVAVSRFDRRPPERDSTRINERIRVPEVRLIDENGEQVGIIPTPEALERARERELDLVEVSPTSKPPVCRILDYSKYKYEQEQKAKAARKHQQQVNVREIKLRPKIAQHDYETKRGHVERFLKQQDKVKVTIMFRGREQSHPERGRMLLDRLLEDVSEIGVMESPPLQEGRNMTMLLGPARSAGQQQEAASS